MDRRPTDLISTQGNGKPQSSTRPFHPFTHGVEGSSLRREADQSEGKAAPLDASIIEARATRASHRWAT
jgi:hypothetical protein